MADSIWKMDVGQAFRSLGQSARGMVSRAFTGSSAGTSLTNIGFNGSRGLNLAPKRGASAMLMQYGVNSRLRAPVERMATDIGAVHWRLYRVDETAPDDRTLWQDVTRQHALGKLLRNPSEHFSWSRLMYLNQLYWELVGESFMLLDVEEGPPSEILPVPPTWVVTRPMWNQTFYTVMMPVGPDRTYTVQVPKKQMIWIRNPDPRDPWAGLGASFAVDDEIQMHDEGLKYNHAQFRNGATPGTVISAPGMSEQSRDRLQKAFDTRHGGFWNAFKTAVINADVKITEPMRSQRDMQFLELLQYLSSCVSENFHIPPELLGKSNESNRAAIDSALYIHATQNLVPDLNMWAEELNRKLTARYGDPTLELGYISPVRESAEFLLKQANEGLTRGAITVNEWRSHNGFAPDANGDERLIPVNVAAVGADGTARVVGNNNQGQEGLGQ